MRKIGAGYKVGAGYKTDQSGGCKAGWPDKT
jgi:hypothetical protein